MWRFLQHLENTHEKNFECQEVNILERNVRDECRNDLNMPSGQPAPPLALLNCLHMLRTQQCA